MSVNNLVRALEIISVGPAYFRGLIGKQIYLSRAASSLSEFPSLPGSNLRQALQKLERTYMDSTDHLVSGDKITPGGFYTGVWCRDASYIVNELAESGKGQVAGRWLEWIWSHAISNSANVIHGRGSPEMGYKSKVAGGDFRARFNDLLPSSIQHGYIEVYGKSPDIDSTALMISVTCKFCSEAIGSAGCDILVPHIERAVGSLKNRDTDGDGLIAQGPNEAWMSTMLRSGRVVYSQAAWGRAIMDWSKLLHKLGRSNEAERWHQIARDVATAVNEKLWDDQSKSYSDSPEGYDGFKLDSDRVYSGSHMPTPQAGKKTWLTQDASLFLLMEDYFAKNNSDQPIGQSDMKAKSFLDTLKARTWRGSGAACLDPPTSVTGPFKSGPSMYQNGGFWPWISSLEILARLRYDPSIADCEELLIKSIRYSFLEWVNPVGGGSGAYPFRTSIAAVRTALRHYSRITNKHDVAA